MERLALLPPGACRAASSYLATLAPRSQQAMRRALERVAVLCARVPRKPDGRPLARLDLDRVDWGALTAEHLAEVRSALLAAGAPASARQAMCGLRGVLARLGALDAARLEATRVPKAKPKPRPFTATGHVRDDAVRALRACGLTLPKIVRLDVSEWRVGATRVRVGGRRAKVPDELGDYIDHWLAQRGDHSGPLFCRTRKGGRVLPAAPISVAAARRAAA